MKKAPAELYNPPMKYRMMEKRKISDELKGTSERTDAAA